MSEEPAGRLSLRDSLTYDPVELSFGTSGLRGKVEDITNLEAYVNTKGFLAFLLENGDIRPGRTVCVAGDLRPSTDAAPAGGGRGGEILQAVLAAVRDSALHPLYLGKLPTPALMYSALRRGAASIMVTGSHIPFDRNGIKLNRSRGEALKEDEGPVLAAAARARAAEYGRRAAESPFDVRGMFKVSARPALPAPAPGAALEYVRRYLSAFPAGILSGMRVMVWQHSAVGRDILVEILAGLGARVVAAGRSESFVAVDTEAVSPEMLSRIQELADGSGGAELEAVVSTDGDGDRPLLLGVDAGRVRFIPGDLLGAAAADWLGAREVAVPVSANDAVDLHFAGKGVPVTRTRIGSPHVIQAMTDVGWEANGGFLTARPIRVPGGGTLQELPTRDAVLPLLAALSASRASGVSVSALFERLPRRFGSSALLRELPRGRALGIVRRLRPAQPDIDEAVFDGNAVTVLSAGSSRAAVEGGPVAGQLREVRARLEGYFTAAMGFGPVRRINWVDGVRVWFTGGDVAHIRPSGNAPELRVYANAGTKERAEEIASAAAAEGGILRRMEQDAGVVEAFLSRPSLVRLRGVVQHYEWGGRELIPDLIGRDNSAGLPFAELWIGAHLKAPAVAELEGPPPGLEPLDALVAAAPDTLLGERVSRRFGGRLPYLFKVLDARSILSLQAHPARAQAEEGFARENSAGIPLAAPERNYGDDNHKPEVQCALTDFWMLHGFRPLEEIAEAMGSIPELGRVMPEFANRLAGGAPAARRVLLRDLYAALMTMPQAQVDGLLPPVISRLEREGTRDRDTHDFWVLRAARELPLPGGHHDRGILSMYLLNLLRLRPGQGTFQPAGTLHAYLEGACVELMASSDNVLRGGLTAKRVDVPELLRILSFESGVPRIIEGRGVSPVETVYPAPAEEFLLRLLTVAPGRPFAAGSGHSADCLIVMEGTAAVRSADKVLRLGRGGIALAPAGTPYSVEGEGEPAVLFTAGVPQGEAP